MKKAIIWIGALIVGAILGLFGIAWLNDVMSYVATIHTTVPVAGCANHRAGCDYDVCYSE